MRWETVIGLEIHCQLATKSKLFSGAPTAFGAAPNTQACIIDLGLPGVLPVLNAEAVRMAVIFGLAVNAKIGMRSVFARKNYFYPDLPKGYQISQFEHPIVGPGEITLILPDGTRKRVGITRAHLEEDAGKSLHEDFHGRTGIDLNRAGIPLLEIVSEPDLRGPVDAVAYVRAIHSLVRWLGISDGNMEEGSFRCDVNISLRPEGETTLGTRTELKNLNSFRFIEKAIVHEVERQREILEDGGRISQETRLYDPDQDETRTLRSKEDAHDYRYFPDPDLLPVVLDEAFIASVRAILPELPEARRARFVATLGLSEYDAFLLTADKAMADYFEAVAHAAGGAHKLSANWVMGEVSASLNREGRGIAGCPLPAAALGKLILRIQDGTLSSKLAKQVFEALWSGEGADADAIIQAKGLTQVSDTGEIERWVTEAIAEGPKVVEQVRAGNAKAINSLVGIVMKKSQGKANPAQVTDIFKARLGVPAA
jgi:aspartyl-tRNA(Asn)/glutamyl-tRNA(Gln) amidotransferase subunit B